MSPCAGSCVATRAALSPERVSISQRLRPPHTPGAWLRAEGWERRCAGGCSPGCVRSEHGGWLRLKKERITRRWQECSKRVPLC